MTPRRRAGPRRIRSILKRLEKAYGPRVWPGPRPAVDVLISTVLSQNTNDRNRDRAFVRLRERFRSWDGVAAAEESRIEEAIRVAGLGPTKAGRIRHILRALKRERGDTSLDFLADMPLAEAMDTLCAMPGVGKKTAACVLLFAFNRPAFPVDTHIHRVAKRLGLIPEKADRLQAQDLLQQMVPPDAVYPFHLLLIELGRRVCHARNPDHAACPLRRMCPSSDLSAAERRLS